MRKIIEQLKENNQDFEWYPTTQEIIDCVNQDLETKGNYRYGHLKSVLDIGAGDGRVLTQLNVPEKYAIEKSSILANRMDNNISLLGADFDQNTLIDKKVDVIFCNPPYQQYAEWTARIINEANCKYMYLVIPSRWVTNEQIKDALQRRKLTAKVLHDTEFSFMDGDRPARAKVNVVYISLEEIGTKKDPFKLWFDESFNDLADMFNADISADPEGKTQISKNEFSVSELAEMYDCDLDNLYKSYQKIATLDKFIFQELGVDLDALCNGLKLKIQGLKSKYWKLLFDKYEPITSRLTSKVREQIMESLLGNTAIDFTTSNAYMITQWVIKNANSYYDQQLIDWFYDVAEKDKILKYKSNERVFKSNDFRYNREASHFKLDYRIITERYAFAIGDYWTSRHDAERLSYIKDLLVIMKNLGFDGSCNDLESIKFESGKKIELEYKNHTTGETSLLMDVKFYNKGSCHMRFNKKAMLAINVNVGRILGWFTNPEQASKELNEKIKDVSELYQGNIQIERKAVNLLLESK